MPDALWHWLGYGVTALSMGVVLWALFWDRSRGRQRCRKCFYDMSAAAEPSADAPATCPECGKIHTKPKHLFKSRRRLRWVGVGVLAMVVGGYGLWVVPRVSSNGWPGVVPTGVLILMAPWLPMPPTEQTTSVGDLVRHWFDPGKLGDAWHEQLTKELCVRSKESSIYRSQIGAHAVVAYAHLLAALHWSDAPIHEIVGPGLPAYAFAMKTLLDGGASLPERSWRELMNQHAVVPSVYPESIRIANGIPLWLVGPEGSDLAVEYSYKPGVIDSGWRYSLPSSPYIAGTRYPTHGSGLSSAGTSIGRDRFGYLPEQITATWTLKIVDADGGEGRIETRERIIWRRTAK